MYCFDNFLILGQTVDQGRTGSGGKGLEVRLAQSPILALPWLWGLGQDPCASLGFSLSICVAGLTKPYSAVLAPRVGIMDRCSSSSVCLWSASACYPPKSQTAFWMLSLVSGQSADERAFYLLNTDTNHWIGVLSQQHPHFCPYAFTLHFNPHFMTNRTKWN